jgi:SAM-dependent methyltransferase
MSETASIPILDVRPEASFVAGHAPGAVNIPVAELAGRAHELPPKGAAIRLFAADPRCRRQAALALRQRGYAVREAALTPAGLTQTGPSRGRLWRPSPFLVEALERIAAFAGGRRTGRRAADLACGAGREAVYLALSGYKVDAFDALPDALQRASNLARRSGVRVRAVRQDLERGAALPARAYDLVTVFRFLHRPLLPAIREAVAPGGFVAYETFNRLDRPRGRPPLKPAHTVGDGELAAAFEGFEVVLARDGTAREGRRFSQLLARRADNIKRGAT